VIVGFIGDMGGGKSLSMVKQAKQYYDQGYNIYSNIKLNFPYETYNLTDILQYAESEGTFYKAVFLIDEAHIYLDSRMSASKRNIVMSYFITQTRKKDVKLLYTTQSLMQVDKRLRERSDMLIYCFTKIIDKKKDIRVTLNYIVIKKMKGNIIKKDYFISNDYYNLYDTYEVVKGIF